ELPALGVAAFAMLGLAAGLAPRRPALRPADRSRPLASTWPWVAVVVSGALILGLNLAGPWLAERYTDQALGLWRQDPEEAFDKLDRSRSLNPLSPVPDTAGGSIAVQLDRPAEAEARYRAALDREPGDSHLQLRLGAIVFNEGRRAQGLEHLREAARLDRRDPLIRRTLRRARRGREIDIKAVNRAIAERYREIGNR
ncbi:MAG TPA: hypothetical protein VHF58_02830, partial [Solirubrobacterales bacterium]|nr:hypothetical protein [Solirubrobacterales bacterium]